MWEGPVVQSLVQLGEPGKGEMRVELDRVQMRSQVVEFVVRDEEREAGFGHYWGNNTA